MTTLHAALVSAALLLISPSLSYAQESPLQVTPVGIPLTDDELAQAAVMSIVSPGGPALPGIVVAGATEVRVRVTLDVRWDPVAYAYACPAGRCIGTASDVWMVLPDDARHAYLDGVMDAVTNTFPNRSQYVIRFLSTHRNAAVIQNIAGTRTYLGI